MLRKVLWGIAVFVAMTLSMSAQTADELIAKNIQARGGLEKIKAIKTIRYTGKMTVGPGMEVPMIMEQKRPNSMRMEMTIQGLTMVQAYDGKTGWVIMPFQGKKDPEPMGEDDLKVIAIQADMDGPLIGYKEKGYTVELLGKEPVEGTDAYKLKVDLKNGNVLTSYLDADSFLEIKNEMKMTVRGAEREAETSLGNYQEVEGVLFPFSIETGLKGNPQKQKITLEKIEINPTIEDARFAMPAVPKPEAKPEEKKPQ